jgi:Transmembrane secretion effector
VKRQDVGTAGATGLLERTGTPADGEGPPPVNHTAAMLIAPAALWKIRTALGIAGSDDPKSSNWQALAQPRFRRYFAGSVVSNFGTWLQNTAQVALAYQLTHQVFWVGMVTCAQFSSPLFLGPWAGVLTHRLGNWRTLIVTQCASMGIALALMALQFAHLAPLDRAQRRGRVRTWPCVSGRGGDDTDTAAATRGPS